MPSDSYAATYKRNRGITMKQRALAYLGGSCAGCGSIEDLDFHHVDPSKKSFTVSTALRHRSWEVLAAELDKCELRCKRCHHSVHESDALCGTVRRYWRGCRCSPCRSAMSEYNRQKRPAQRLDNQEHREPVRRDIDHGTRAGYLAEKRRGIPPCDLCTTANATYTRELRARKKRR